MSEKLNKLLRQVNDAAGEIMAEIRAVDDRIATLNAERQAIGNQPVTFEEFIEYIGDSLDKKSEYFVTGMKKHIHNVDPSFFYLERGFGLDHLPVLTADSVPTVMTEGACFFYFKPLIMERLASLVDGMNFPAPGTYPSIAERREKTALIDAELNILRSRRAELAKPLSQAGILG